MSTATNPCTFPDCADHECQSCGRVRRHQNPMPVCPCKAPAPVLLPIETFPCTYGHFDCSWQEGGLCSEEAEYDRIHDAGEC